MLLIRNARLSDVPEIANLHCDAWVESNPGQSLDVRLALWNHVLGGGPRRSQVWVAIDEAGSIVGFASAGAARVLKSQFQGEITTIYVSPKFQRRGVGRALVEKVWEWFRSQEYSTAMCWVPAVGKGQAFLQSLGAQVVQESRSIRVGEQVIQEIAMAWRNSRGCQASPPV
jgi:ribosomal protein S18 acetylase RimI-like enzyme